LLLAPRLDSPRSKGQRDADHPSGSARGTLRGLRLDLQSLDVIDRNPPAHEVRVGMPPSFLDGSRRSWVDLLLLNHLIRPPPSSEGGISVASVVLVDAAAAAVEVGAPASASAARAQFCCGAPPRGSGVIRDFSLVNHLIHPPPQPTAGSEAEGLGCDLTTVREYRPPGCSKLASTCLIATSPHDLS
jgi:hypothetical protein